jgi:hypothetical protein
VAVAGATLAPMTIAAVEALGERQQFLDESLRIAVWELLFGTGTRARVEELLLAGARWRSEELNEGSTIATAR